MTHRWGTVVTAPGAFSRGVRACDPFVVVAAPSPDTVAQQPKLDVRRYTPRNAADRGSDREETRHGR